jgi:hypothetical protein
VIVTGRSTSSIVIENVKVSFRAGWPPFLERLVLPHDRRNVDRCLLHHVEQARRGYRGIGPIDEPCVAIGRRHANDDRGTC